MIIINRHTTGHVVLFVCPHMTNGNLLVGKDDNESKA